VVARLDALALELGDGVAQVVERGVLGGGHVTRSTTAPAGIDPASVALPRVPPVVR
jgi:hypothetical protein